LYNQGAVVLKDLRWGLIPFWAKDEEIGYRMINARAETLKEKPLFRSSLKRKRCLVLADFFYEWQKIPGSARKQPMCIRLRDQEPFVFAGLWDAWKKPDDVEVESYTIISAPGFAPALAIGKALIVIRPIHRDRKTDLLQIAEAISLLGLGFGLGESREQQGGQNRDDRNDHQQLNQCESPLAAFTHRQVHKSSYQKPFAGATFNEKGVRITQARAKCRAAFRSSAFRARRYAWSSRRPLNWMSQVTDLTRHVGGGRRFRQRYSDSL
jgi:hypothetical protein